MRPSETGCDRGTRQALPDRACWLAIGCKLLAAILALPIAAGGQARESSRNKAVLTSPSPAKLAIWTDSPGYTTWRHTIRAYLAMRRMNDRTQYYQVVYVEHVPSGDRKYWQGLERGRVTGDKPPPRWSSATGRVPDLGPILVWSGRMPEPGTWRFVAEIRSRDRTELVKRVASGFVVSWKVPLVLGSSGNVTEILSDTTWGSDRIRVLRGPVYVHAGATLTLEPGTLVLARGADAAIIVAPGGRIDAQGRPDAPVILTCEASVGEREPGCWGGLVLLGHAPTREWQPTAPGVAPPDRGVYGGDDAGDSSGVLRYVRVEFAGAGSKGTGFGFYGVGSGTVIDHIQSHASGGVGIRYAGGTGNCGYCVSSGAAGHGIALDGGWAGKMQHVYVQQAGPGSGCGIHASEGGVGLGAVQRSHPQIFNVTLARSDETRQGCDVGILFQQGAEATARNLVATGFRGGAVRFEDELSKARFAAAGGSISHLIADPVGDLRDSPQPVSPSLEQDPDLVSVAWQSGPDPRPWLESPVLLPGSAALAPSDGWFDANADYVGAFNSRNWLEEWTFFGPESDYAPPDMASSDPESAVEAGSESYWSPDPPWAFPGALGPIPAGTDALAGP